MKANISILVLCIMLLYACGTPSQFPLSLPSNAFNDDRIVGNWKMEEDTNKYNFYEITQRDTVDRFNYHIRFFDKGGTNPTYEVNIFFSELWDDRKKVKLLNIPYWEKSNGNRFGWNNKGYFFVRLLEVNDDFSRITTATVNDKKIANIRSAYKLQDYIEENINNPKIYSDTVHFYKVNKSTKELRQPRK